MGDDGDLALSLSHHALQHQLTLGNALIDALAGGAANIQTLNTLLDEPAGQCANALGADCAVFVIAGIEGGNNAFSFLVS
jgi:hypothetical protein